MPAHIRESVTPTRCQLSVICGYWNYYDATLNGNVTVTHKAVAAAVFPESMPYRDIALDSKWVPKGDLSVECKLEEPNAEFLKYIRDYC